MGRPAAGGVRRSSSEAAAPPASAAAPPRRLRRLPDSISQCSRARSGRTDRRARHTSHRDRRAPPGGRWLVSMVGSAPQWGGLRPVEFAAAPPCPWSDLPLRGAACGRWSSPQLLRLHGRICPSVGRLRPVEFAAAPPVRRICPSVGRLRRVEFAAAPLFQTMLSPASTLGRNCAVRRARWKTASPNES